MHWKAEQNDTYVEKDIHFVTPISTNDEKEHYGFSHVGTQEAFCLHFQRLAAEKLSVKTKSFR